VAKYPFGKDFTYRFTPMVDSLTLASIPAQAGTVKLYIYTEKPTKDDALLGTGADYTITGSWTLNALYCDFTVTAIDDPNQDSTDPEETYYAAVVFKLKAAGQDQVFIRELILQRAFGHDENLYVVSADLEAVYSAVTTYASSNKITANIDLAMSWIKRKLKDKGYEYQLIHNLADLKLTVTYRALAQICLSLIQEGGSEFETLYEDFNKTAEDFLNSFIVSYDSDSDGEADIKENNASFQIVTR